MINIKIYKPFFYLILFFVINMSAANAEKNFFNEAKQKFEEQKLEESKFLFQRNIVFNPKDFESYFYLAKIYQKEENKKELEKNLNTTLLLKPDNEEAIYMLIDIKLKQSDFDKVNELKIKFSKVCNSLCSKLDSIEDRLKNIEAKNES